MLNTQEMFKLEFVYRESFTNRTQTAWGELFCNENQPNYYGANHAHIDRACEDPQLVIDEVRKFFQSKNIFPRFYIYNIDEQRKLIEQLKLNQFKLEEFDDCIQLWDQKVVTKKSRDDIAIELVTQENYNDALEIQCSIKELGGREVREKAFEVEFNHPNFVYYLLRYKGVACATACIFIAKNQARLEMVATLEAYRGRGLIGELIRYIQGEVAKMDLDNLWVSPFNERVEKVYQKYGFETVGKQKMVHAYLGGLGIKEIQE